MDTLYNPSQYLQLCLDSYAMGRIKQEEKFYREKRDIVQKALEKRYRGQLAGNIILSGSVAKSTEINIKYDVDLIVPFRWEAFPNLEEMTRDLYKFLQHEFQDPHKQSVRNQRVSVGLSFSTDAMLVHMDVVPGREAKRDGYAEDRALSLYDTENNRHFQTNIHKQVAAIQAAHDSARKIIRLLKVWKHNQNRKVMKGFVLELLTLRAFQDANQDVPAGLWPQLRMVLIYIRDHLENVKLVDPGNGQNIVSALIPAAQKREVANAMRNMLNSIDANPPSLRKQFPLNPRFSADL